MTKAKIAPSILAADFSKLAEEIRDFDSLNVDWLQLDIMDGHFVPSFVGGLRVVAAVKRHASVPVDVHLMVSNPGRAVPWFIDAGADIVFFHPEAADDAAAVVGQIHQAGRKAGVALKPGTPHGAVDNVLDAVDLVLVMSVNPGFGGQAFIAAMLDKISALRAKIDATGRRIDLEVDGGINAETAPLAVAAGADVLIAGTAAFSGGPDCYADNIARLKGA